MLTPEHYSIFVDIAMNCESVNAKLLSGWYQLDNNTVPPIYQLQPITSQFPHFNDYSHPDLCKKDQEAWWIVFDDLQQLFWKSSHLAVEQGLMSTEEACQYQISVTEDEIKVGMLQVSCAHSHSLAYIREFDNILAAVNVNSPSISRFIDLKNNQLDMQAQRLLRELKGKVTSSLGQANVKQMNIPWTDCGVNVHDKEHEMYLDSFCSLVFQDMKRLIDEQVRERVDSLQDTHLYHEVLSHSWFCANKCKMFCGQEEVLSAVHSYLSLSHDQHPFIVHGASGSGKTSIIAKAAMCARNWLPGAVIVVRFLGTTPDSTTIHSVLQSVAQQICFAFNLTIPPRDILGDFTVLVQYFKTQLLNSLPVSPSQPLLLLLDSIDQLSPADGAYNMNWLPKILPNNIFIIVSTISDGCSCLSVMRSFMPDPELFMEVCPMTVDSAGSILDMWLASVGRVLTQDQRSLILSTFSLCPRPLFLKLLFDQSCHWSSSTGQDALQLPIDVKDAIARMFKRLEVSHGSILIRRSIGYVTAAKYGLTQAELEDVLCLDDDVLSDVYQYWDPPDMLMIRLPQLLWKRIRFALKEYLVERHADGRTVLAWYHRQFIEAARDRYLSRKEDINACHLGLVELFSGRWSSRGKPLHLQQRNLYISDANRGVAAQPLHFTTTIPNLRKMNEYPFHLVKCGLTDETKKNVLCSFMWLYSKMQATSFPHVMEDFDEYLTIESNDSAINLLREALLLSSSNLRSDPDCLAAQLVGRIQAISADYPELESLIVGAHSWIRKSGKPMFIPQSSCLIAPGGPLKMSLAGHPQRVEQIMLKADEPVAVSVSAGYNDTSLINVWDLTLGECLHSVVVAGKKAAQFALGSTWVAIGSLNIQVIHLKTGECMKTIECEERVVCLSAAQDETCSVLLAGLISGAVTAWNVDTGQFLCQLFGHTSQVTQLCMLSGGCVAVSGSVDSTVRVWNLKSGQIKFVFQYHHEEITCLAVCESAKGGFAVSGSSDKSLRKWCFQTGKCTAIMEGHTKTVKDVSIMPGGNACISASLDCSLRVWNLNSGICCKVLKGHEDGVWCVTLTASGSVAVSGSKDDLLKVWEISTGECIQTLEGHSSWISCVATSKYGKWVVSGSNDKLVKVWNIQKAQKVSQMDRHNSQPTCITASNRAIISGASDGIKVWSLKGHCLNTLPSPASCIALTSNGRYLISGGIDKLMKIWDIEKGCLLHSLRGHKGIITALSVAKGMAFTGSADGSVKVWSVPSAVCIDTLCGHKDSIKCIAVSKDAQMVASGSLDMSVRLWVLAAGLLQHHFVFEGHTDVIWCIELTRDTSKVASGASDKTVRVWDIQSQKCLHVLMHQENVKALAATNDSERLISADHSSYDQLRVWSLKTGACLRLLNGHNHAVMSVIVVDDDRFALSGSRDGTIKLWSLDGDGLPLASFDAQSQIKYLASVSSRSSSDLLVAATTKSGPICILNVFVR
jgi:WD40 repeat protein